jgi:uncharacterized membrane protein YhaH (DUF805 family)
MFMNWYLEVLKKYAQFDGRSRRKEYWFFALFNCLVGLVLGMLGGLTMAFSGHADNPSYSFLGLGLVCLYSLAVLIPGLAVTVRRLHDTGRSGWWIFISFVPFVGGIILLIFMLQDSHPGPNQYGPNPKGIEGFGQLTPAAPF